MKKIFLQILLCVSLIYSQQNSFDDTPLATVGNSVITRKEFVSRFELTPGLNRQGKNSIEAAKAEFLLSMIAEKILAAYGGVQNFDNDSIFRNILSDVERLLVRDELYRKEISDKIVISNNEIQQAIKRSQTDLKAYFITAKTKEGADFLYAQIKKGKPLESFSFVKDSLNDYEGPDSAIARWGDVEERMENVIYSLKLNETSTPFQLDDGFYIVKVMGKTMSFTSGSQEQTIVKERVTGILRKRKEFKRMTDFMNQELKTTSTQIHSKLFKQVVVQCYEYHRAHSFLPDTTQFIFDKVVVASLAEKFPGDFKKTFVTFPHTVWTLETALNKIASAGLIIPKPSHRNMRIDIEQRLRDVIDQEYLTVLGYKRGLHQSNAVRKDMKVWRDAYLSQYVRQKIADTVFVNEQDLLEGKNAFANDTALVRDAEKFSAKVKSLKMEGLLDRFIGKNAGEIGITIFEQNLKTTEVTRTPSMVFRFLGFGGRMFAVPFVVPQIGWINYTNEGDIKLP